MLGQHLADHERVLQVFLGEVAIAFEVDELHDTQQDLVLDGYHDLGLHGPALGITEFAVELQAGMDVSQLFTVFDILDNQCPLAQGDVTSE